MRDGARSLGIAGLILCLGVGLGPARVAIGDDQNAAAAAAVLRQAAAKYAAVESYQEKFTVTQRVVTTGKADTITMEMVFAFQRPNRLRANASLGRERWVIASDGATLWVYMSATGNYVAEDAPATFEELAAAEPLDRLVFEEIRPVTLGVFGADPYGALTNGVQSAELVGTEALPQGEADHVTLRGQDVTLDVWFSKADSHIVQARLDPWRLVESARALHPELESVTIEIAYQPLAADAGLPSFIFEPPAGATRVATVADLSAVTLEGRPLIDFTLEGLEEGTTVHLADYRGRVVALDFWAVYCPPCREELPKLSAMYRELKDKGFVVLAVNVAEKRAEVASFLKQLGVDVPVALDSEGKAAQSYGVESIPKLVLIGRDDTIQAVYVGYGPSSERTIRAAVGKLLGGESLLPAAP
jgi:peroxiredoxin